MIKKPKRKNPNKLDEIPLTKQEIELLEYNLCGAVLMGNEYQLVNAIQLTKIGAECGDCGNVYFLCKCEYCEDCGFNRCLCGLEDKIKIREFAWDMTKDLFNKKMLQDFKSKVLYSSQELFNKYRISEKAYNYIRELLKV